jgi:transposase-like protein
MWVILLKWITNGARKFSPRFKADAVQMVIETGKPVAEVVPSLAPRSRALWVTG